MVKIFTTSAMISVVAYFFLVALSCLVCLTKNQIIGPLAEFMGPPLKSPLRSVDDLPCSSRADGCTVEELRELDQVPECATFRLAPNSNRIICLSHQATHRTKDRSPNQAPGRILEREGDSMIDNLLNSEARELLRQEHLPKQTVDDFSHFLQTRGRTIDEPEVDTTDELADGLFNRRRHLHPHNKPPASGRAWRTQQRADQDTEQQLVPRAARGPQLNMDYLQVAAGQTATRVPIILLRLGGAIPRVNHRGSSGGRDQRPEEESAAAASAAEAEETDHQRDEPSVRRLVRQPPPSAIRLQGRSELSARNASSLLDRSVERSTRLEEQSAGETGSGGLDGDGEQQPQYDKPLPIISPLDGEKVGGSPMQCKMFRLTFRAIKEDGRGNRCTGLVNATICYGGCETGEISDYSFPSKKSVHKICTHDTRLRRRIQLSDCTNGSVDELRNYHYIDAGSCSCNKCTSKDTTCAGNLANHDLTTKLQTAAPSTTDSISEDAELVY